MYCYHCGKAIKDGETVCPHCGKELHLLGADPKPASFEPFPEYEQGGQATGQFYAPQPTVRQCPYCRNFMPVGSTVCPTCRSDITVAPNPYLMQQSKKKNICAILGFAFAIAGFVSTMIYLILGLDILGSIFTEAGLVLSIIGLVRRKRYGGNGKVLAILGIVIAAVAEAVYLVLFLSEFITYYLPIVEEELGSYGGYDSGYYY